MRTCRWYVLVSLALLAFGCGESSPRTPQQLVQSGRFDEAIQASTQLLRANPRDAEALLYRARAYHCRNQPGDIDRAIDDFTQAIDIAPTQSEAYYSRALAYRDKGDADASAKDEKTARKNDPRLKDIYSQLPDAIVQPAVAETKPERTANETQADKVDAASSASQGLKGLSTRFSVQGSSGGTKRADEEPNDTRPAMPKAKLPPSTTRQERMEALLPEDDLGEYESPSSGGGLTPREKSKNRSRVSAGDREGDPRAPSTFLPPRPFAAPQASNFNRSPIVRSPFPQRPPAPTGFVEPQPTSPQGMQPRQNYSPYSAPTVRLPGAYHDDFNP